MTALNSSAVRRDIDDREDELDEIARLKAAFTHVAERLARKHSGIPEHGRWGWRATVDGYIDDFLGDLFCERERQIRADNDDDLLLVGERS